MKLPLSILIFACLLGISVMVGCEPSPSNPSSPPPIAPGPPGKVTLENLANGADFILVGTVTDIASQKQDNQNIYTEVTLSVEQTLKGKPGEKVVVKVPGGEAGGIAMMVTDNPSFQLGERAVVFLNKEQGVFTVFGGFQGKFTIDESGMVSGDKQLTEFINEVRDILEGS
jgi:hypothetical protein